ncbi:MAG: alpha/beta hydrolase [Actinocatenispora sp.]
MVSAMRLADGRQLSYAEWGDPDGFPVVHFHGTPGSRVQRYPNDSVTRENGVRFIVPDRPGYGGSDPVERSTLLGHAEDVDELLTELGIDTFAAHGISGGGPFALAAAWRFGPRVTSTALLACVGPMDRPDALEGMHEGNAQVYRVAIHHPEQLADALANFEEPTMPKVERAALARVPGLLRMALHGAEITFQQGDAGVLGDYYALAVPWTFPVGEITTPVRMWHGVLDELVPVSHSAHLAEALPDATFLPCEGEAHFSMFAHQREVLSYLTGTAHQPA